MGSKADKVKGRAKQAAGEALDDDRLRREGQLDAMGAKVKQAAEKGRDLISDGVEAVKRRSK